MTGPEQGDFEPPPAMPQPAPAGPSNGIPSGPPPDFRPGPQPQSRPSHDFGPAPRQAPQAEPPRGGAPPGPGEPSTRGPWPGAGGPAPAGPGGPDHPRPANYGPPSPGPAYVPGAPEIRPAPNFAGAFGPPGYPPAGYEQQYGGYPYPVPRPRRTGLVIGIIAGVVVLVGVGLTLFFVLRKSSGPGSTAQATADSYLAAMKAQDTKAISDLSCAMDQDTMASDPAQLQQILGELTAATVTMGTVVESGSTATAMLNVALSDGRSGDIPIALYKNTNGTWLVCDNQLAEVDQDR